MKSKVLKKIAVVQMWPEIKAAEDEVIARIINTCSKLDVEVLLINTAGEFVNYPGKKITSEDVDFVIHLHFETPKTYDVFSFVALWNPLQFYFDWGYRKHSLNMISHDDFLSCDSTCADQHIERLILNDSSHLNPSFNLFHSLSEPICNPSLGDMKLFYVGINWEKLGKGKGRHHDLLQSLDRSGDLVIYGPKVFQGINVWAGFNSYVEPLPFDGVSVIKAINKAGITLVLSSHDHIESGIMSSRLFEGLAAGSVIIVDENPFAKKHFKDSLLYIKTQGIDPEGVTKQVREHLDWIKSNPKKAIALAGKAQKIFKEKFDMTLAFKEIYKNLPERKKLLSENFLHKTNEFPLSVFGILKNFSKESLDSIIDNYRKQSYKNKNLFLLIDEKDYLENKIIVDSCLALDNSIKVKEVTFFNVDINGSKIKESKFGSVIFELLQNLPDEQLFSFLFDNETIFSDHYSSLVRKFEDDPQLQTAYTNMLLVHSDDSKKQHFMLVDKVNPFNSDYNQPNGYSRFLFKFNRSSWLNVTVKYMHWGVVDALYSKATKRAKVHRASSIFDIQKQAYQPNDMRLYERDMSILIDSMSDDEQKRFSSEIYDESLLKSIVERKIKFGDYSYAERLGMIAKLLEALQLPRWLLGLFRRLYWFIRK